MSDFKDIIGAAFVGAAGKFLDLAAGYKGRDSKTAAALRKRGLALYKTHYYQPFISQDDLRRPLHEDRLLPGIKLDSATQLGFIESLKGRDELAEIPDGPTGEADFYFNNGSFDHGDADIFYSVIRNFRPKNIIEIGSGNSTKIGLQAIARNKEEDLEYQCRFVCVEPYEQPWLETAGVEVMRERVELIDPEFFDALGQDDILFIDSSHIIRPQGDVLFEILEILPRLKPGVIVQIHDIHLPYDYLEQWVLDQELLWNEQYLLQAFLSMNDGYEILSMGAWLAATRKEELTALLPGFAKNPTTRPGSIWLRRI